MRTGAEAVPEAEDEARLRDEADLFTRYLVSAEPPADVTARYVAANRALLGGEIEWSERRFIRHEAEDPAVASEGEDAERRLLELRDRLREEQERDPDDSVDPSGP